MSDADRKKTVVRKITNEASQRLHKALLPVCDSEISIPKRKKINFMDDGDGSIYLLTKGRVSIYRSKDDIIIADAFAPAVLGLANAHASFYGLSFYDNNASYYALTENACTYYKCSLQNFVSIVEEQNLWHDVARILGVIINTLITREKNLTGTDAYNKIKHLLIELSCVSEDIRKVTNAQSFIQNRSGLSRSRIMKILATLKEGGYIEIQYGRLTCIKKKLPESF